MAGILVVNFDSVLFNVECCFLFCCRNGFVRADRVLLLRELLDKLSSTAGLVNEEKGV